MRARTTIKVMNTVCGKTINYIQTGEGPNKAHSTEGPAIIYPESDNKAPEYYLYGLKHTKTSWKSAAAQCKNGLTVASDFLDSADATIYY